MNSTATTSPPDACATQRVGVVSDLSHCGFSVCRYPVSANMPRVHHPPPVRRGRRQFTLNATLLCMLAAFIPLRAIHAQTAASVPSATGSSTSMPSASMPATSTPATGVPAVNIPAGSLTTVLDQYAQATGVSLSFDAGLTAGAESAGLQGQFSVQEGFRRILQGSGLEAVNPEPGRYTLRRQAATVTANNTSVTRLAPLDVSGYREGEIPNTGYTVRSTSSATKLDLAPKETPQSITTFTAQQIQDQGLLTLGEILEHTPGITLVSAGVAGAGQQPVYARTFPVRAVQMDGVMASSYILSGNGSGDIGMQDSFLYERIDVIRGSTSLTGGEGDASASLNFVRKHPYLDRELSVNVKYGSWNNRRAELDFSTPINDRLRVRLAAATQKGDHWVERVHSDRSALSLIGELDLTDKSRLSLGATQFNFMLHGASPHGVTRYSELYIHPRRPAEYLPEGLRDMPRGTTILPTTGLSPNYNNATPWSYSHRRYTNLFATWQYDFTDDWSVKASYNYARNKDDRMYGEMGSTIWLPQADMANYTARRDNEENLVNAVDVHLKGSIELLNRRQDFVLGFNAYNLHHMKYAGYDGYTQGGYGESVAMFGACRRISYFTQPQPTVSYEEDPKAWEAFVASASWKTTCSNPQSVSRLSELSSRPPEVWDSGNGDIYDMYNARTRYITSARQTGYYFAMHLRPLDRVHLILGGRQARDRKVSQGLLKQGDKYYLQPDCLVDNCPLIQTSMPLTNPVLRPRFLPYGGLIVELTPQINAYGSYTTSYMRDLDYNGENGGISTRTGDFLPPVRSITEEGGLKGAFFNQRLNVAASYFKMWQKDFPNQGYDPKGPVTNDKGWRVYGWEFNMAGAITKNWNISMGYVRQKQILPPIESYEVMFSAIDDLTASYRAPEQSFKLFTTWRHHRLTLGAGLRWQSRTQSAWIPETFSLRGKDYLMKQNAWYIVDLMARYRINKHLSLQLNVNNAFNKVYYQHERSWFSGPPRNALLTLSYHL